jgi:hypothetical protein
MSDEASWLLTLGLVLLFTFALDEHIVWLEWALGICCCGGIIRLVVIYVQRFKTRKNLPADISGE